MLTIDTHASLWSATQSFTRLNRGLWAGGCHEGAECRFVVDAGGGLGGGILRLIGIGVAAFILVIALFNCVTRVGTGHVGVLTLFGRVTGETLGEGIHVINPLKTNNEMSIQTQTIKESASVPSSEGLMMALDTSLIYHLNPDHAADVFQKIGADYEEKVVDFLLELVKVTDKTVTVEELFKEED